MAFCRLSFIALVLLLAVVTAAAKPASQSSDGEEESGKLYMVGDDEGWGLKSDYAKWASDKKFAVGDVLVFSFVKGEHDVAEVTKDEYEGCTAEKPLMHNTEGSFVNVPLKTGGAHYFICTVPGHCTSGQKLAVSVGGSSGTPAAIQAPTASTPKQAATATAPTSAPTTSDSTFATAPAPTPVHASFATSLVAAGGSMATLFSGVGLVTLYHILAH